MTTRILIKRARLHFSPAIVDVRIGNGRIAAIAPELAAEAGETVIAAHGCALLPGLHDHHLHLPALAASLNSVHCGPPHVADGHGLATLLTAHSAASGWLRGIGYHECVAGDIDRDWLDRYISKRPVRIQHRTGRLWIFNSAALSALRAPDADTPFEKLHGRLTGRLYDADGWLRERLAGARPSLREASQLLASRGVTGITEVTPFNTAEDLSFYATARDAGELLQDMLVMGDASLDKVRGDSRVRRGGTKIHLHDDDLPGLDSLRERIALSHAADRPVAIHCVTQAELVLSLEAIAVAGAHPGDRIEHASIAPVELLPRMKELAVTVVTQPNFIWERGDQYLSDVDAEEQSSLYRAATLRAAGIPIAAGTDAPFGMPDPWRAMQAAVDRRTRRGVILGAAEALSPEEAFDLFSGSPDHPGERAKELCIGAPADLCLIDRSWQRARSALADTSVLATFCGGTPIWQSSSWAEADSIAGGAYA